jgi:phosphatidylglycerophosphatase A
MTFLDRLAHAVATVSGIGHMPVAPGTFGTLAAVPLAWALAAHSWFTYAGITLAVTLVGIAASEWVERHSGEHDSGHIVIDEVAGYLWTCIAIPRHDWRWLLAAFVLFRVLDIAKPPPIGWLDRRVSGGLGVVIDDVVAGMMGAGVLYAVTLLGPR